MRKTSVVLPILFSITASSQVVPVPATDPCYKQSKPLSFYAYRKMMRDHYTFTILGSQTPVSGFKVETNKPSITLKGNIITPKGDKDLLVNLELSGAVNNDLQQIFSGKQLNALFKASLGFNKLLKPRSASYGSVPEMTEMLMRKRVCEYREDVAKQVDTLVVLLTLQKYAKNTTAALSVVVTDIKTTAAQQGYRIKNYTRPQSNLDQYYEDLLIAMIKKYGGLTSGTNAAIYQDFIDKFANPTSRELSSAKIAADIKRCDVFEKNKNHKYHLIDAYEIETYKDIWTSKSISWINVSFAGTNSTFKMYDAASIKLSDGKSFLPSASITYNYFRKKTAAHSYFFIRTGVTGKRVNTLVDLPKFDYKKETTITTSPGETLKTEKSGTAFQGELKHGTGIEIPVEVYWAPWSVDFIPGFYFKTQYSYGEVWINKNKVLVEGGLVLNLINAEKDSKHVLTIVPYFGWNNIIREYKDEGKLQEKKMSDLFAVGVKFGIPVNLGK